MKEEGRIKGRKKKAFMNLYLTLFVIVVVVVCCSFLTP